MGKLTWGTVVTLLLCFQSLSGNTNPLISEKDGRIIYLDESNRVVFTFLGLQSAQEYGELVTVQLLTDSGNTELGGNWTELGIVTEENEMAGPVNYTRFARVWICPDGGNYKFEIILHVNAGEQILESIMADATIVCQNAGDAGDLSLDGIEFDTDAAQDTGSETAPDNDSDELTDPQKDAGGESLSPDTAQDSPTDDTSSKTGCSVSFFNEASPTFKLMQLLLHLF